MKSELDKKIDQMALGIPGVCKTRQAHRRSRILLMSVFLVLFVSISIPIFALSFAPEPPPPEWNGAFLVFAANDQFYEANFQNYNGGLLSYYDMTLEAFEEAANVSVCPKAVYEPFIYKIGLEDELDPDHFPLTFPLYMVILDENWNVLYKGNDVDEAVTQLNAAGFAK